MSFKEKTIRVLDWCKEHKEEIIITTVGVVGLGAVCYGTKKTVEILRSMQEKSREQYDQALEEFEVGMFINGIRKQFLDAKDNEEIPTITDSIGQLRNVVGEDGLCALRNGNKILVMTHGVSPEHGNDVINAVKDTFSEIDDLEIWVGGTVKE